MAKKISEPRMSDVEIRQSLRRILRQLEGDALAEFAAKIYMENIVYVRGL